MKIKKLRKKLQDKKWLEKKYERLADEAQSWDSFRQFKCNNFFVGYEKAEFNLRKYNKNIKRVERQIDFIKTLLKIDD